VESFGQVRAALAIVIVCLWPASAAAQTAASGADVEALSAEVDRDYASALAADCTMACQALDSMRRATEHLCAIDAGDRCARARQKLADATAHVRAACPACGAELRDETGAKGADAPATKAPTEAPAPPTMAEEAQVSKRGGCAGCATSSPTGGDLAPLGAVAIGLLALRRRTRR
jgi:MYXO-CTERM domain-containing protein